MSGKKFVDGLFVNDRSKAPEFVKAKLSFLADKFIPYLQANANAKGYIYIDILESKDGKMYAKLNDYKPAEASEPTVEKEMKEDEVINIEEEDEEIRAENIPF